MKTSTKCRTRCGAETFPTIYCTLDDWTPNNKFMTKKHIWAHLVTCKKKTVLKNSRGELIYFGRRMSTIFFRRWASICIRSAPKWGSGKKKLTID